MSWPYQLGEFAENQLVTPDSNAELGQKKLASIAGMEMNANAKMRGMTPPPAIRMGMTDD